MNFTVVDESKRQRPLPTLPLTDPSLTRELRGLRVAARGETGEIRVAYDDGNNIRAYVRFPHCSGWLPLTDLEPEDL